MRAIQLCDDLEVFSESLVGGSSEYFGAFFLSDVGSLQLGARVKKTAAESDAVIRS